MKLQIVSSKIENIKQSSIHYLEKLKEEREITVEVITPEKGKPEGINSQKIRSEEKKNYV